MTEFNYTEFALVGISEYDLPLNDTCLICRKNLNETDPSTKEKGNTSNEISIGACGHAYHRNCLRGWTRNNNRCPYCSQKWVTNRTIKNS